jgi:hypothetical protein
MALNRHSLDENSSDADHQTSGEAISILATRQINRWLPFAFAMLTLIATNIQLGYSHDRVTALVSNGVRAAEGSRSVKSCDYG